MRALELIDYTLIDRNEIENKCAWIFLPIILLSHFHIVRKEKGEKVVHDWQIENFFFSFLFAINKYYSYHFFPLHTDNIFIKRFLFLPARTDEFLHHLVFSPLKENGNNGCEVNGAHTLLNYIAINVLRCYFFGWIKCQLRWL